MSDAATISTLEKHVTRLLVLLDAREEELLVFKSKFKAANWEPCLMLDLTPVEAEICAFMLPREHTSKAQLYAHLYSDDPEPLSLDFFNSIIQQIDTKLEGFGVGIMTLADGGYRFTPNGKHELRRLSFENYDAERESQRNQKETANVQS